jgi:hypothetical protein
MGVSIIILMAVLWIIPFWKVLDRTGKAPAWCLLALIPIIGPLILLFLIAYEPWPRHERGMEA